MAQEEEKNPFHEYAKEHTIGGLRNVLLGDSIIRRIVWFVVFLILLAGTGYSLRNSFRKIINPPTSTTISTQTVTTLDFPAVTICNLNIFSSALARQLDPSIATIASSDIAGVFQGDTGTCKARLSQWTGLEGTDYQQLIRTEPQDLISKCTFSGRSCDFSTDFVPIVTHLGVCFTFNSGRNGTRVKNVTNVGVRSGLQLELNVDQANYLGTFAGDAGVKIAVHPQSDPPLPDELGIGVPPGHNAFIGLRKRAIEDKTEINCGQADDTNDWNFLQITDYNSYSQAACLTDRFMTRVADQCDCVVTNVFYPQPTVGPYSSLGVCNFKDICCNFQQYTTPLSSPCNPACFFDEYRVSSTSYSQFPANHTASSLSRDDSASANVYFETLTVESQTTEFSYGVEEFFGELGGQLHLLIGANIICLFELVFFVFDVVKFCVMCRPCRRVSSSRGSVRFTNDAKDIMLE